MNDDMELEPFSISLDTEDRCDRCGAQAYTLARNEHGQELLFCGHHKADHEIALEADGWAIYDDIILIENHLAVKV